MSRWLPMPLMSLLLLALWLLLNDTLAPGQVLLGGVLAVVLPQAAAPLRPLRPILRRPGVALRLALHVAVDIVRANFFAAGVILGRRRPQSGFVRIALELRDPHGLAALACIVTATPGTLWAHFDDEQGVLTLHVLALRDEAPLRDTIKLRYERPLREIFE